MKKESVFITAIMIMGMLPVSALANGNWYQTQTCGSCGNAAAGGAVITDNALQYMNQGETEGQNRNEQVNSNSIVDSQQVSNQNQFRERLTSFEEEREKFYKAREQFRNRVMEENQFQAHVVSYLNKSIDKIDSLVSKIRDRIQDREFDRFLNQTRLRLQNCTNKSELIEIAKQIRDEWNGYRIKAKHKINEDSVKKLNGIILNANGLARKINATIQVMNQRGIDTTNITAKLNQFQEKVRLAYEYKERAKEMLGNFSDDANREQVMNEAHEQIMNSQQALREAHQLLKQMLAEIKQKLRAVSQNPLNSTENESEEENSSTL